MLSLNMDLKLILFEHFSALVTLISPLTAIFQVRVKITLLNSQTTAKRTNDFEIVYQFFNELIRNKVLR